MKLLNLCSGAQRPGTPWTNVDRLKTELKPGTPERANLDAEDNYVEVYLPQMPLPFLPGDFDGVLAQHCLEHFTCHDAVNVLVSCRRVLKPGGMLVASVPDADYFLDKLPVDTRETAEEHFGEPISTADVDSHYRRFFDYALLSPPHKQILTVSSLTCLLHAAGFPTDHIHSEPQRNHPAYQLVSEQLNRLPFSAILYAYK